MKVGEAIRYLQDYDPEQDLVIAWWDRDMFPQWDGEKETFPTDEGWEAFCEAVDANMDWSRTHESLEWVADHHGVDLYGDRDEDA